VKLIPLGSGPCSCFGGPNDAGVGAQEGLALVSLTDIGDAWFARLFGPINPRLGAARNLNPKAFYCAMAWAYGDGDGMGKPGSVLPGYSRDAIRRMIIAVQANGLTTFLQPADWGPDRRTGRLIDSSPAGLAAIRANTDDIVSCTALVPEGLS
jgi:hypothetical protein